MTFEQQLDRFRKFGRPNERGIFYPAETFQQEKEKNRLLKETLDSLLREKDPSYIERMTAELAKSAVPQTEWNLARFINGIFDGYPLPAEIIADYIQSWVELSDTLSPQQYENLPWTILEYILLNIEDDHLLVVEDALIRVLDLWPASSEPTNMYACQIKVLVVLDKIHSKKSRKAIERSLHHPSPELREDAIEILETWDDPS